MENNNILDKYGIEIYHIKNSNSNNRYMIIENNTSYRKSYKDIVEYLDEKFTKLNINYYISNIKDIVKQEDVFIDDVVYKPINEKLIKEDNKVYYNEYKHPKIFNELIGEGDFPNIKKVLMNLVNNDEKAYNYFNMWLSHIIQNPSHKIPTSIILQGTQGSGKSFFFKYIMGTILDDNYRTANLGDIEKKTSYEYLINKTLILFEEIINNNDDRNNTSQIMKDLITNPKISITRMHKSSCYIDNYINAVFASNNANPFKIEHNDRRFSVFRSDFKIDDTITKNIANDNEKKEIKYYLHYLLNIEIDYTIITKPFDNEARRDLIEINKPPIQLFRDNLNEYGGEKLLVDLQFRFGRDYTLIYKFDNNGIWFVTKDIYKYYKLWCVDEGINFYLSRTKFTQELKHLKFRFDIKCINGSTVRCIFIKS